MFWTRLTSVRHTADREGGQSLTQQYFCIKSENCNFALLLLVVVWYLVESTKLQTVDRSIKLKKQQLLILPRIALENILKYFLFPLCSFHLEIYTVTYKAKRTYVITLIDVLIGR